MNGILYLLDQAGQGLVQLNAQVEQLRSENEQLRAQVADLQRDPDAPGPQHGPPGREGAR